MKLIATVAAAALVAGALSAPAVAADNDAGGVLKGTLGTNQAGEIPPGMSLAAGIIVKRGGEVSAESGLGDASSAMDVAAAALGVGIVSAKSVTSDITSYDTAEPISVAQAEQAAEKIAKQPGVEWAEPNRFQYALSAWPNPINDAINGANSMGPLHNIWDVRDATAPAIAARAITPWPAGGYGVKSNAIWGNTTGVGATVAVIDSGVLLNHPDLAGQLLPGYDMVEHPLLVGDGNGRDADPSDPGTGAPAGYCGSGAPAVTSSWHGTHVAGTIAAVGNNGIGVAGVAPGAKIVPVRALGKCGVGTSADIAAAMVWAAGGAVPGVPTNQNPAKILNMSLGGYGDPCPQGYQDAIDIVRDLGASIVVAAGNDNKDVALASPANCNGVISIAATSPYGDRAPYSNFGANVDLAAPGGEIQDVGTTGNDLNSGILSLSDTGTLGPVAPAYAPLQGTSMATPAAAGVAALIASLSPTITPDGMEAAMRATTIPFATSGNGYASFQACNTTLCGTGSLDATKLPIPLTPPTVTGTGKVGQTLTATMGTWGGPPTTPGITWLADGVPVGEGMTYVVSQAAIGADVVAFMHGSAGYEGYGLASAAVPVAGKLRAKVRIKGKKKVRVGSSPRYKIRVRVPGVARGQINGKVRVSLKRKGRRSVQRATFKVTRGVAAIKLIGIRRPGVLILKAKFPGNDRFISAKAKKRIRIVRRR